MGSLANEDAIAFKSAAAGPQPTEPLIFVSRDGSRCT
jgi:hypothetical protein